MLTRENESEKNPVGFERLLLQDMYIVSKLSLQ